MRIRGNKTEELVLVKFAESKVSLTREYCKYDACRAECDFVPYVYVLTCVLVLLVFHFTFLITEYLRGWEQILSTSNLSDAASKFCALTLFFAMLAYR